MTAYWAWKLGPERARRLIMSDPIFTETREMLRSSRENEATLHREVDALKTDLLGKVSSMERDMIKSIDGIHLEPNVVLKVPDEWKDTVIASMRSSMKREIEELFNDDLVDVLAAAMQKAVANGGGSALTDEQATAAAEAAELHNYLGQIAEAYRLPQTTVTIAENMGRRGLRWINDRYALGLTEAELLASR